MRRALRIVFWTYLVLLHGLGAYVGYKLYGEWKHKQAFITRVERMRVGPGFHAMMGATGDKSTAVTRLYTPQSIYVARIEEEAGASRTARAAAGAISVPHPPTAVATPTAAPTVVLAAAPAAARR